MREIFYVNCKRFKKASGQARQPNIAPDSAQSKTRINILYGLAEGRLKD